MDTPQSVITKEIRNLIKVERYILEIEHERGNKFLAGAIKIAKPQPTIYLTVPLEIVNRLGWMGIDFTKLRTGNPHKKVARVEIVCHKSGEPRGIFYEFLEGGE